MIMNTIYVLLETEKDRSKLVLVILNDNSVGLYDGVGVMLWLFFLVVSPESEIFTEEEFDSVFRIEGRF